MEKWILGLLTRIMNVISPDIRGLVVNWLNELETRAKATPNPWDDIFVTFLKMLLVVGPTPDAGDVVGKGEKTGSAILSQEQADAVT